MSLYDFCLVLCNLWYRPSKQDKLTQCWANVVDGGSTFNQQRVNVLCLLRKDVLKLSSQIVANGILG